MTIPGIEIRDGAPPPLPPLRTLPFSDASMQRRDDMKKDRIDLSRQSSLTGRSLLANGYGSISPYLEDTPSHKTKGAGSINMDERYSSYASTKRSRDSLPTGEFGLHHNQFQFQSAADIHGDCMKKLDPIRTMERPPPPTLLTKSSSSPSRRIQTKSTFAPSLSMPIQLPVCSRILFESQTQASLTFPAISRRFTPFHHSLTNHRTLKEGSELNRSPRGRRRNNSSNDVASTEGSFGEDMEINDTSSLKRRHIENAYTAVGQKRQAASPASNDLDLHSVAGQTDAVCRRDGASRGSPALHLATGLHAAPAAILTRALGQNNFYISNTFIPSAAPAANSSSHPSPGGISLGVPSPASCTSPYVMPASLNRTPWTSPSRAPMHAWTASGASPRKLPEMRKSGGTKFQGFMCESKKSEIAEELSAHEAEKQYECIFCGNRFKNKNEMERHQNSLHVRRHSWSCSALSGYHRAFHESTSRPGETDACGYCGKEFSRSGHGARSGVMNGRISMAYATDQDRKERIRHLQDVHKFRECNSSKKFYRADHFRQHLKHSHAGTSGKWTNMLVNACLMEEDPSRVEANIRN